MLKTLRIILIPTAALIILLSIIGPFNPDNSSQIPSAPIPTPETQTVLSENEEVEEKVLLVIDFGDQEPIPFEVDFVEGESPFSLLKRISGNDGLPLETQEYDFGVLVQSINGVENSDETAWIYFVNNQSGDVSSDQYLLQPGDLVEWKYTILEAAE